MFKSEYDQIIRENFNLSDTRTRKYIVALEDAGQEQLLAALSSALYDKIVSKVDDIDFGTIPLSRGDITKVEGFAGTEECLNIIRRLVIEYKQDTSIVDVVITAIQNIKDRKPTFIKAYALNVELPMVIYNTMVLSIERSTSLMIATCMEYVKDPASESPKAALDKVAYQKTMDDLLFKQLISFNNMCTKGTLDKTLDACIKHPSIKEDVEVTMQIVPPADPDENADDAVEDIDPASPFVPNNTVEPFAKEENEAAPEEFPEEENDANDDVDPDAPITSTDNDSVEPENIPNVAPGDEITPNDRPIVEDEAEDQRDLPVEDNSEVPVEEKGPAPSKLGISAGTVIAVSLGALFAIKGIPFIVTKVLIPALRAIVYTHYYTKMKISDYLEIQAQLIEANANDLQYSSDSNLSEEQKKKVIKKQLKWAKTLREWSNKFAIDNKATNNKANKEIEADKKHKNVVDRNDNGDDVLF